MTYRQLLSLIEFGGITEYDDNLVETAEERIVSGDKKILVRHVSVADNIALTDSGSLKIGDGAEASTVDKDGFKVSNTSLEDGKLTVGGKEYITNDGVNANSQKISNVADGKDDNDAVNMGQLYKVVKLEGLVYFEKNLSVVSIDVQSGGKTLTSRYVSVADNISLTDAGSIDIGTGTKISDGKLQVADTTIDSKGFEVTGTEEGSTTVNATVTSAGFGTVRRSADGSSYVHAAMAPDRIGLEDNRNGEVAKATGITTGGIEILDNTQEGETARATLNTQTIGIAVTKDNKLFYSTGITAKGIEIADNSNEDVTTVSNMDSESVAVTRREEGNNKQSYMDYDGYFAFSGPKDDTVEKIVGVTTGTDYKGQKYEAGLYVGDETTNEMSSLTVDKLTVANKAYITKNGINANDQKITNVADGKIAQNSKDAVNGGQLWDAYNRTGNRIDNVITDMNSRFDEVHNDMSAVGSQAAAMSALQPVPYNPYAPTTITAGLGFYRSDQAVAVGVYHYIRDSVLLNIGGAFNLNGHGDAMGRAGVSFAVGKGAGKGGQSVGRDMTEMQKMMADMQKKISDLEAKDKEKDKIIEELKNALDEKKK